MKYVLVIFSGLLLSACSSMGHWGDSSGGSSSRDSGSSASSRNSSMGMMRGNDGAMNPGYNYSTMPLHPGDLYFGD